MVNTETREQSLTTASSTTMALPPPTVSSIPSLHAFDPRSTTWESYRDRISFYFKANRIDSDEDKKALFLWSVGDTVYSLLESFVAPQTLTDEEVTYDKLIECLNQHYDSTKNIMTASFDFFSCYQKPGQSFQEYKAELCNKLKHCGFTSSCLAKKPQDRAMRDMYVIGLRNAKIRQALLKEKDPDLETTEKIIQAAERLQADMRHFDTPIKKNEFSVAKIQNDTKQKRQQQRQRNNINPSMKSDHKPCDTCGLTNHRRGDCKYREFTCNSCKKKGHLERVCRQKKESNSINHISTIYKVNGSATIDQSIVQPSTISLCINGHICPMEVDTGAVNTIIDIMTWHKIGSPSIHTSKIQLKCYSGSTLHVKGECLVNVEYNNCSFQLPIVVVHSSRPSLLGLHWIHQLKLDLNHIIHGSNNIETYVHKIVDNTNLQQIIQKHQMVLNERLGYCTKVKAHIQLKTDAQPKFYKSRTIPFAYTEAVKEEIQRNVTAGIIERIDTSEWAAPIVPVKKPNGKIRICRDFKVTVNSQIWVDQYPIPSIDELLARLNNGIKFTKLDLSDAYLQIELDEDSKKLVVINTPMGLFRYNRMPFGISNAPAIFQRAIDQVIAGIPNSVAYLDDILITGKTEQEHLQTLDMVLSRLAEFGFTCNPSKCSFFKDEVTYLGYIIDKNGKRPDSKRIDAIIRMPVPQNVKQLESFIGKVNYYGHFIPKFSTKCKVLNKLRQSNVVWQWTPECQQAFDTLLHDISTATTLVHFDSNLRLILCTDASQYGIGAVIMHRYDDGLERPIAHASRTLTKAEQNYSQIEKEALSIVYGVKKFHQYLIGRNFELNTDHRPLLSIFNPTKPLPATTANRLQRWAIFLMGYTYSICFKPTHCHTNADALSRLPLPNDDSIVDDDALTINFIQTELEEKWPLKATEIAAATDKDSLLQLVRKFTLTKWPASKLNRKELLTFFNHRNSLSVVNGCVLRDIQVIIPTSLQGRVLRMLHDTHLGTVKMKQLARSYCWWPSINKDIEEIARSCTICSQLQPIPNQQFKSWDEPTHVWSRVHMDFLGPLWNSKWLVLVDAKSKFPVVVDMGNNTSGTNLIQALEQVIDWFGPPQTLVSDNGPPFNSYELIQFYDKYGINHVTTAPYHPASNGLAERFVRSFKEALLKEQSMGQTDKSTAVRRILRTYRWSPHTTTGESPANLILQHSVRTEFDLMKPAKTTEESQTSKYSIGQLVWMLKYQLNKRPQWKPALVTKTISSILYEVQSTDGQRHKRHQNQLRPRFCLKSQSIDDISLPDELIKSNSNKSNSNNQSTTSTHTLSPVQRYPKRNRRPPVRYTP